MNKKDKEKYVMQSIEAQRADDNFISLCRSAESLFSNFHHTYGATTQGYATIEDLHYSLMLGINRALESLRGPYCNLKQEEKDQKIKYLLILQEKIVKSKELLVFL